MCIWVYVYVIRVSLQGIEAERCVCVCVCMNGKIVTETSRSKEKKHAFSFTYPFLFLAIWKNMIIFKVRLQIYKIQVFKPWSDKLEIELPVSLWSNPLYLQGDWCRVSWRMTFKDDEWQRAYSGVRSCFVCLQDLLNLGREGNKWISQHKILPFN